MFPLRNFDSSESFTATANCIACPFPFPVSALERSVRSAIIIDRGGGGHGTEEEEKEGEGEREITRVRGPGSHVHACTHVTCKFSQRVRGSRNDRKFHARNSLSFSLSLPLSLGEPLSNWRPLCFMAARKVEAAFHMVFRIERDGKILGYLKKKKKKEQEEIKEDDNFYFFFSIVF